MKRRISPVVEYRLWWLRAAVVGVVWLLVAACSWVPGSSPTSVVAPSVSPEGSFTCPGVPDESLETMFGNSTYEYLRTHGGANEDVNMFTCTLTSDASGTLF